MQCLRREVGAVWPHDGAEFLVKLDLCEEFRVPKRLEDAAPRPRRQVQLTLRPVLETQAQTMFADHLDRSHMHQLCHGFHLLATASWVHSASSATRDFRNFCNTRL